MFMTWLKDFVAAALIMGFALYGPWLFYGMIGR